MSKDLGPIEIVGAEAIGQPGQRRFRLFAMIHNISVALWMEKEQLNNLSIALDRILAQLTEGRILRTEAQASPQHTLGERLLTFQLNPNLSSRSVNCVSVMMRGAICWY